MYSTQFKHKNTTRDLLLRSVTNLAFFFRQCGTVFLPGAVWCGAVHTCSLTRSIDRFMMSEGGDPLSLPLASETGQSHSVVQNRQTIFFFFFFFFFFLLY